VPRVVQETGLPAERLALLGREAGDEHEPRYLRRVSGNRDDSATVGVADQEDRCIEPVDNRARVSSVAVQTAQRVRRSENRVIVAVALENVKHGSPAGCVCERAMDEDDRWTGHIELLFGLGDA
jgi:hypothetical protein